MEAEGIPIQPSSYSSKQVTVRIIIITFIYPTHPLQKEEVYPSHTSSRNTEAKHPIISQQFQGTTRFEKGMTGNWICEGERTYLLEAMLFKQVILGKLVWLFICSNLLLLSSFLTINLQDIFDG